MNEQPFNAPEATADSDHREPVGESDLDTQEEHDLSVKRNDVVRPSSRLASSLAGIKWLGKTVLHAVILVSVSMGGFALIGVAQRAGWIRSQQGEGSTTGTDVASDERYICPMMCTPPSNAPGRCPVCGMELVAATNGGAGDGISVTIEPAARRLIGIETAISKRDTVTQTIRTIGSINYDESKLATISAYVGGRIEKLYANYVGVPVGENDDVALVYSPELYSAQVEYLASVESGGLNRLGGATRFNELAAEKLIELGLTEDQVADLRARGVAESRTRLRSPIRGTVVGKFAVEGDYLEAGKPIYRIADLSTVWLMLDLFPDDAARIRFGQRVEAEVNSVPGEVFVGRIAFIDPTVDTKTRTVRVRVEMLNLDGALKPGDFATARLEVPAMRQDRIYDEALAGKYISPMHPQIIREVPGDCPICSMPLIPTAQLGYESQPIPEQKVVTVPRSAVLMTGRNGVIYVETTPGRFEIRQVTVGPLTDDQAIILGGLDVGETVATHGNFLIDSQMQLAGNPSLMDPSRAPKFAPGPLQLPNSDPVILAGEAAIQFDRAYQAYFIIQKMLAADHAPNPVSMNTLEDALGRLVGMAEVPDAAQQHFHAAKRSVLRMSGSLEQSRSGFRSLSHALLKAATIARGASTSNELVHMYCPMVPGGGGDWMQPGTELLNPYWGSEMLTCGEVVRDLAVGSQPSSEAR